MSFSLGWGGVEEEETSIVDLLSSRKTNDWREKWEETDPPYTCLPLVTPLFPPPSLRFHEPSPTCRWLSPLTAWPCQRTGSTTDMKSRHSFLSVIQSKWVKSIKWIFDANKIHDVATPASKPTLFVIKQTFPLTPPFFILVHSLGSRAPHWLCADDGVCSLADCGFVGIFRALSKQFASRGRNALYWFYCYYHYYCCCSATRRRFN